MPITFMVMLSSVRMWPLLFHICTRGDHASVTNCLLTWSVGLIYDPTFASPHFSVVSVTCLEKKSTRPGSTSTSISSAPLSSQWYGSYNDVSTLLDHYEDMSASMRAEYQYQALMAVAVMQLLSSPPVSSPVCIISFSLCRLFC
jgi:hypothetical protein